MAGKARAIASHRNFIVELLRSKHRIQHSTKWNQIAESDSLCQIESIIARLYSMEKLHGTPAVTIDDRNTAPHRKETRAARTAAAIKEMIDSGILLRSVHTNAHDWVSVLRARSAPRT
jgi:hypothetical protein